MGPANKTNLAINNGISIAKIARRATRNKIKTYTSKNKHLQLLLLNSLVEIAILYGLRIIPPTIHNFKTTLLLLRMHKIHWAEKYSELTQKPLSTYPIRGQYNVPTIESILKYHRSRMYETWGNTPPRANLGYTDYVREQLNTLPHEITPIGASLRKFPHESGGPAIWAKNNAFTTFLFTG